MSDDMSRRSALIAGACLAAGAIYAPRAIARPAPLFGIQRPLGLQLFTVMDAIKADAEGTLAAIARLGFRRVELVPSVNVPRCDCAKCWTISAFDAAAVRCPYDLW